MIELTDEFRDALARMETGAGNLFITGRAGTGKSTLLQQFRETTSKNVAVLAPTGVAAINVKGQTIHSFFGFKPNVTLEGIKTLKGKRQKLYQNIETLVLDEVSMVRADLFDAIARFLELNGPHPGKPFGGVSMILFGDLYQLPPVVRSSEAEIFRSHYESPYFFSARSFASLSLQWIELTRVFRQVDTEFLNLLNRIRNKTISDVELDRINLRVQPPETVRASADCIVMATTNGQAETINQDQLMRLPGKTYAFKAGICGDFGKESFPTATTLELKTDAQVMLLNNDSNGRWVNGTLAKIKKIHRKEEVLQIVLPDGSEEEVVPYTWEMFHFEIEPTSKQLTPIPIGTFTQMPMRLAWAITIHKSQGLTFDRAVIDLTHKTFAHGQLYVAVSRLRTLEGLMLTCPVRKEDIWLDYRIQKFITGFQYQKSEAHLSLSQKTALLEAAIRDQKIIEIVYLKASDEKTTRKIRPIRMGEMVFAGKKFSGLVAYCMTRQEDRTFRVDRILEMNAG